MIKASNVIALESQSLTDLDGQIKNRIEFENSDPSVIAIIANTSITTYVWHGKNRFAALITFHYYDVV